MRVNRFRRSAAKEPSKDFLAHTPHEESTGTWLALKPSETIHERHVDEQIFRRLAVPDIMCQLAQADGPMQNSEHYTADRY